MRATSKNYFSILLLLYFTVIFASEDQQRPLLQKISLTVSPRRIHVFEAGVKVTLRYTSRSRSNITQAFSVRILDKNDREIKSINDSISLLETNRSLGLPCELFFRAGKYRMEYYVEGSSTSYRKSRNTLVVRKGKDKLRIIIPSNHTALSRSLFVLIARKRSTCQPYNDKLHLYWIKSNNNPVLVHTKTIKGDRKDKQTFVKYGCNILDAQGLFYFEYISGESGKMAARSTNISIVWGKYELSTQSRNIFPCSTTFAVKFTSPYCSKTEDKVEIRSKLHNNFIASQSAFPGFKSVFFKCDIFFDKFNRYYCFYYITKSTLTKTEKVQAQSCVPFQNTVPRLTGWSEWSNWGDCSSRKGCGLGDKYRLRTCQDRVTHDTLKKSSCNGSLFDHSTCYLSSCQATDCCGCVLTSPVGTIVSPKWQNNATGNNAECHWIINVASDKRVKLWFDTLKLSSGSIIDISDGNGSEATLMQTIKATTAERIGDIISSFNIITIRYHPERSSNETNTGFQLSYASVDAATRSYSPSNSPSEKKQIVKMVFIGVLATLILVMIVIFFGIICKVQHKPQKPPSQTKLNKPTNSSQTSSACMSDSTLRSIYELGISGDESSNNNYPRFQQTNSRPRVSGPIQMQNNRACAHVCPRCCHNREAYDVSANCQADVNQRIYTTYSHSVKNKKARERLYRTASDEGVNDDYL